MPWQYFVAEIDEGKSNFGRYKSFTDEATLFPEITYGNEMARGESEGEDVSEELWQRRTNDDCRRRGFTARMRTLAHWDPGGDPPALVSFELSLPQGSRGRSKRGEASWFWYD